jgi:peptidyl-tRNA hydrolase
VESEHDWYDPSQTWAMQLAVRDDRPNRPTHLAVCEAAAAAVVLLLTDPRAVDGDWTRPVQRWTDGRIRKVVRRGRNAPFDAATELDGVGVERNGAYVKAFVPGPVGNVPKALAKLQVGGTDMPEHGEPAEPVNHGLDIAITPDYPMTTGKAAAQSGHAAQLALMAMTKAEVEAWESSGWAVRVSTPGKAVWDQLLRRWPVTVADGGFTEVPAGTVTALACWARCWEGDQ